MLPIVMLPVPANKKPIPSFEEIGYVLLIQLTLPICGNWLPICLNGIEPFSFVGIHYIYRAWIQRPK